MGKYVFVQLLLISTLLLCVHGCPFCEAVKDSTKIAKPREITTGYYDPGVYGKIFFQDSEVMGKKKIMKLKKKKYGVGVCGRSGLWLFPPSSLLRPPPFEQNLIFFFGQRSNFASPLGLGMNIFCSSKCFIFKFIESVFFTVETEARSLCQVAGDTNPAF